MGNRPTVVCLCGPTKFVGYFRLSELKETMAGRIVLGPGVFSKADHTKLLPGQVEKLGTLHKAKIDMSDEILVHNVGGYIGDHTREEIAYAKSLGKKIRWFESVEGL